MYIPASELYSQGTLGHSARTLHALNVCVRVCVCWPLPPDTFRVISLYLCARSAARVE